MQSTGHAANWRIVSVGMNKVCGRDDVGFEPEARIVCGGGNSIGRKSATLPITLQFTRDIKRLRDERTDKERGNGWEFVFDWKQNEAVVVSFDAR